jgi:hypothetical protein
MQLLACQLVSLNSFKKFMFPEFATGCRGAAVSTSSVAVPEATMHIDHCAIF